MSAFVTARLAKKAYERGEITADELDEIERDAEYEAKADANEWE